MAPKGLSRFAKILVPIDVTDDDVVSGKDLSRAVRALVAMADWIADASDASITLIAVVGSDGAESEARAILESVAKDAFGRSDVKVAVAQGVPYVEIVRQSIRDESDLILMASRRPGMLERTLIGSTAMRVLRKAECPVCVVSSKLRDCSSQVILSAAALQELTPEVLDISASLAQRSGGEWHVVHCLEYPKIGDMRLTHVPQAERDEYRASERKRAWDELHALCDPIEDGGVPVKLWLAEGTPSEQVALAVRRLGADLVVLGTIGRAGLHGALVGNTAEKLLNSAECSVLAVKPAGFRSPVRDEA